MAEGKDYTRAKNEIIVYCKHLLETIKLLFKETSGDGEKEILLSVYQDKCISICTDVNDLNSASMSEAALCKYLQRIAQLVLDLTFVEESRLIDQEFPQQSSFCKVKNIIENLQSVEDLAFHLMQDKSISNVLSTEILECLYWRKGALLYMYCHTLNSQFSDENMPKFFIQILEHGIKFITSMLCTRSSPKWLTSNLSIVQENYSERDVDDEADVLYAKGILSDTHLLALMYCGEMCYWHTKQSRFIKNVPNHMKEFEPDTSSKSDFCKGCFLVDKDNGTFFNSYSSVFDSQILSFNVEQCISKTAPVTEKCSADVSGETVSSGNSDTAVIKCTKDYVRIGQLCLENYIHAARGQLFIGGWNTARAEEILQYFYNLKW